MFLSAVSKVITRIIAGIAMCLVIEVALSVLRDLGNSNLYEARMDPVESSFQNSYEFIWRSYMEYNSTKLLYFICSGRM